MRPDGAGTDERATSEQRSRRPKSADALERHLITCVLAFVLLLVIGWGAFYLSRRAVMPDLDSAAAVQQQP